MHPASRSRAPDALTKPAAPAREDPLRLDLLSMAFGPKAERIPPAESFSVSRLPP